VVETGQAAIRLPRLPFGLFSAYSPHYYRLTLGLLLIEPFLLVPTEPEKGFALLLLPDFEPPVLPNLEMLSSLAHFLKPTFREKDCSPDSKSRKHPTK
jgi:hypothetical protein